MDIKKHYMTRKASLTVEASFVVPIIIVVIGIVMSLWFYKYQVCWYTQAVNECLLTGSNQSILNENNGVNFTRMKWKEVEKGNYLVPQELLADIEGDDDKICMNVHGKTHVFGRNPLELDIKQEIKIIRPVDFIQKIAAIKGALGN